MVFNFDSNGITFQNKGGAIINNENITVTSNGTYTAGEGYTGLGTVDVNVADIPAVTEELNVTPTTSAQTIRPEEGKDGFNPVNVAAVTSSIDANITAGNIKDGVSILGVTGNYTGTTPTLTTKSITQNGTYNASSDNADGYSSVTVNVSGGGGGVGITREVSANGVYQIPTTNFIFSLPSNATDVGTYAMYFAFRDCSGLTSVDLSSLTTVSSDYAFANAFQNCTNLASVDLSSLTTVIGSGSYSSVFGNTFSGCKGLTSIDLSSLTTVSGSNVMSSIFISCIGLTSVDLSSLTTVNGNSVLNNAFQDCTNLASVDLSSLTTLIGSGCFNRMFRNCTSLTTLSFPALTTTSFGSNTNQFTYMLQGVTGCTVHFPSNLQSVIGSWSDVTAGFGGTNTTVLFDLTATT